MGEYGGPVDAFLRESATRVRAALHCSNEDSQKTLKRLRDAKEIDYRLTPGREMSQTEKFPIGSLVLVRSRPLGPKIVFNAPFRQHPAVDIE
jgi:hypothetical protein